MKTPTTPTAKFTTDLATPDQKFFPAEALYEVVVGGVVIGTRKSSRVYRYAVTAIRSGDVRYVISYHSRYDLAEKACRGYDFSIVNTRIARFVTHRTAATEKPIVTNHTVYRVTGYEDGQVGIMGRNVRKTAKCYQWTDEQGAPRRADISTAGYFDSIDEALLARIDETQRSVDWSVEHAARAEENEAYRGQVSWARDQVKKLRFEVNALHAAFFYLHANVPSHALYLDDQLGVPAGLPAHRNPVALIVA